MLILIYDCIHLLFFFLEYHFVLPNLDLRVKTFTTLRYCKILLKQYLARSRLLTLQLQVKTLLNPGFYLTIFQGRD